MLPHPVTVVQNEVDMIKNKTSKYKLLVPLLIGILYMSIQSIYALGKRLEIDGGFPNDLLDWFAIIGAMIFFFLIVVGFKGVVRIVKPLLTSN